MLAGSLLRFAGKMAAVAALVIVPMTSCVTITGTPWDREPPILNVAMREYAYDYPASIPRGSVVFRIVNHGRLVHRLAMVPLAEDFPPIGVQVRSSDKRPVEELAAIPNRPPGGTGTFAVDLVPGRYAFICFAVDPDGQSHAFKGMASQFRVR